MFFAVLSIILFIIGYGDNGWEITASTILACLALRKIKLVPIPLIAISISLVVVAVNYPNFNIYFDIAAFTLITTITAKVSYYMKKAIYKDDNTRKYANILSPVLLALGIVCAFFTYSSQAFLLGLSLYLILFATLLHSPPSYSSSRFSQFYYKPNKRKYKEDVIDVDYSIPENNETKSSNNKKN